MERYIGNGIIQDGILYANVDTYITAVDIKTGQQLWERDDPEAYILGDLIVYNGVVLKCGGNSTYGYNAQTGGDKNAKKLLDLLVRYKAALEQGKSCRTVTLENADEEQLAKELFLLTNKPVMYVCNVDEASAKTGNEYVEKVRESVKDENAEILVIAAKIESDIAELESYEERQMFLEEMGLEESGVVRLIQSAYSLLNLRTYFTAGADECRAWTINKGDKAPKAAGVIHTDFEKGFIRAEVIKYEDFVSLKSEAACRAAGKLGIEGKEYVVQDGDIMHFLFNV